MSELGLVINGRTGTHLALSEGEFFSEGEEELERLLEHLKTSSTSTVVIVINGFDINSWCLS